MKIIPPKIGRSVEPFTSELSDGTAVEASSVNGAWYSTLELAAVSFDGCRLKNTRMIGCILSRFRIFDSFLESCDLSNSDWQKCGITRVEMHESKLTGLLLNGAVVKDVLIKGCKADYMQCRDMAATRLMFDSCNLQNADFAGAYLDGAVFHNCDLADADFSHASMNGTVLKGSILTNVRVGVPELQGVVVDAGQAIYLASRLGMKIE